MSKTKLATLIDTYTHAILMKHMIVGICGSPRKAATEHVLTQALNLLEAKGFETELFTVRNKNIAFCTHCDYCLKQKECIKKDDMTTVLQFIKKSRWNNFCNSGV